MKLDYPVLSRSVLVQALWDRNQFFCSQLKNWSNEGYMLRQFGLTVIAGTTQYGLAALAPQFGGCFLVTTDPSFYPDQRQREVQYGRLQDADFAGVGGSGIGAGTGFLGALDSVGFIAFYSDPDLGGWQAKTYPIGAQGRYIVYYEPDNVGETALENTPQMPASWHHLLAVAAAIDCIGQCEWQGMTIDESRAKRQDILPGLVAFKNELMPEFLHYLQMANAEHQGIRTPYSSSPGVWSSYRGGGRW